MSFFNNDLDERIEREFTKRGWRRLSEGQGSFYERHLTPQTFERMVFPQKITISKRKRGLQAVKRFFDRLFLHKA
jgi:hypothetical protein